MACNFDFETLKFSEVWSIYQDEVTKLGESYKERMLDQCDLYFLSLKTLFDNDIISKFDFRVGVYKYLKSRDDVK